jgi:SAM-dependent methyltransferase
MDVLEIGGGLSGFQFALARAGCRVVNVDPGMETETFSFPCDEASMARLNAVYGTDVQLRNTTLDRAGLADASFDVAFSISVLEHLDDEHLVTAMREAYRVLRPGGRLVMTVDLFLNAAPFTDPPTNRYGRNVDLRVLASHAPFEWELGNPSELHGFPEFDARRILADLDGYLVGHYPALVQCLVLRKP